MLQFALGEEQSGGSLATRLIVEDLRTDEYLLPQYIYVRYTLVTDDEYDPIIVPVHLCS